MDQEHIDFDTLPWETQLPGARFKLHRKDSKQIRLVEFTSEFVEPHWCEKGHIGYVLEGTLELAFKDRLVTYEKGSGIWIEAGDGCAHKASSLTQFVRLVLVEDV